MHNTFIKDREIVSKIYIYDRSENYFEISTSKEKKSLDKMSSDRDNGTKSAKVYCNI